LDDYLFVFIEPVGVLFSGTKAKGLLGHPLDQLTANHQIWYVRRTQSYFTNQKLLTLLQPVSFSALESALDFIYLSEDIPLFGE
jgi:hypothetical protein